MTLSADNKSISTSIKDIISNEVSVKYYLSTQYLKTLENHRKDMNLKVMDLDIKF